MKSKKIIVIVLIIIVSACLLSFVGYVIYRSNKKIKWGPTPLGEYVSQLTEEQHLQNLINITEEGFAEEIEKGKIVNYKVEIVYAFYDNAPKFFLVELEFAKEFNGIRNDCWRCDSSDSKNEHNTKYRHLIGYIENDNYYTGLYNYASGGKSAFRGGQSPYTYLGFINEKKYYGEDMLGNKVVFGVEKDGEILCVYSFADGFSAPVGGGCEHTEDFTQYVPTEEQQDDYSSNIFIGFPSRYNKERIQKTDYWEDYGHR